MEKLTMKELTLRVAALRKDVDYIAVEVDALSVEKAGLLNLKTGPRRKKAAATKRICERKECNKPAIEEKTDDQWLCQKHADKINAFWGEKRKREFALGARLRANAVKI